jgi:hypothetical protein
VPVLGHAFAGWATAACTLDRDDSPATILQGLRLPAFIALAYLPDIAGQVAGMAGVREAGALSHSIGFAMTASFVAMLAARIGAVSVSRAVAYTFGSVMLHDLMDLLQAGSKLFAWPFYRGPIGFETGILPRSLAGETLTLGALAFVVVLVNRRLRAPQERRAFRPVRLTKAGAVGAVLTLAMVLVAGTTHALRDQRGRYLDEARQLAAARDFPATLEKLSQAEGWPSPSRPGRIEHLRGEAYAGLGDRARAEANYLRAYDLDPHYIWAVGDLAVFYAEADLPQAERERLAKPYVDRLVHDFSRHPAQGAVLARVNRKLSEVP